MPLVERARSQHAAVEAIEASGGSVMYDFELRDMAEPPGPRWLRSLIGDDYFMRVEFVLFWDPETTDEHLRLLRSLHRVRRLHLDSTRITDAGLSQLKHLSDLEFLTLTGTDISSEAKRELLHVLPHCRIK
jgi:hypothetical protein